MARLLLPAFTTYGFTALAPGVSSLRTPRAKAAQQRVLALAVHHASPQPVPYLLD